MKNMNGKIDDMLEEARALINKNYDAGYKILEQAKALAKANGYQKGMAWSTLREGSYILRKDQKLLPYPITLMP